jgi:hypothetical protein
LKLSGLFPGEFPTCFNIKIVYTFFTHRHFLFDLSSHSTFGELFFALSGLFKVYFSTLSILINYLLFLLLLFSFILCLSSQVS